MRISRPFVLRAVVAVVAFVVVSAGLLVATSAIALGIDWEIPEGREIRGPAVVYDRDGKVLTRLRAEVEFRYRPLHRISPHLVHAVVATEDRRFYEHQGVDPLSVLRAVVSNVRSGGIRQGGSTLTQQYVKNVYVGSDQTFYRKVREALVALQLEKERSKDDILEAYLNHVYFGNGAYGAEAAARHYFDKPAAELSPTQSAILASVLAAPSALDPREDLEEAAQRRNIVLDEMVAAGFLRPDRAERMKQHPVKLAKVRRVSVRYPYFVAEVRRQLLDKYGHDAVYNGGLRVTTTLDRARQDALESEVRDRLPDSRKLDAGVAAVDPKNGDVLAAYSGRNFDRSQVDLAFGRGTDGRPSGSTFKMFALVTALEEGRELTSTWPAPGQVTIGGWSPSGSGGCGSPCSLLSATAVSSNTVFAQVARDVGAEDFTTTARRMGVQQPFSKPDLPMVLGTADVTPVDMASAAATLANDGVSCPARVVTEVVGPDGDKWSPPDPRRPSVKLLRSFDRRLRELGYRFGKEDHGRCHRAIAPSVARKASIALKAAVDGGTGRRAALNRPVAGKTGTSQNNSEVWFVGYTPQLAMAVSFYNVASQKPLVGIPECLGTCFGGTLPALIWHDAAAALLKGVKPKGFPPPGEDERRVPERRRLGPAMEAPGAAVDGSDPDHQEGPAADQATEPADSSASEGQPGTPGDEPSPAPSEQDDDPDDDDGGILPPLPGDDRAPGPSP